MDTKVNVKFAKVKPNAKIPSKRDEDMGFDIYACFEEEYMVIHPHETKLIPTGIASCCTSDYGFVLRERGSTGSKGIALRAGVIDSGYRNEWFVGLTNTTTKDVVIHKSNIIADDAIIYPYEKAIAQALVVPVPKVEIEELSYEDLKSIKSERGLGAIGSSGK